MAARVIETAKRWAGPGVTTRVRCLVKGYPLPRWGNLRRTVPFSSNFGFERGTPIDRHYLHAFLSARRDRITGDVLAVPNNPTPTAPAPNSPPPNPGLLIIPPTPPAACAAAS